MNESTQLRENTVQSVLKKIDMWYADKSSKLVRNIRFDTKYKIDLDRFILLSMYDRVLCSPIRNEVELEGEFLEKVKKAIK